jgi:hypothetical protein
MELLVQAREVCRHQRMDATGFAEFQPASTAWRQRHHP